jgi:hypothetical protein
MALELIHEASSYEKILSELFSGIWSLIPVIAVMGLIFGPTWEQYERHQAALEFPPPGRLLNIGAGDSKLIAAAQVAPSSCSNRGLVFMVH